MERELENNTNSVIPYFSLNLGCMIGFCIITLMMTDWVKSKPLVGLVGVISAVLGMISHKKSLMTIFGQKHYWQKFHQKI